MRNDSPPAPTGAAWATTHSETSLLLDVEVPKLSRSSSSSQLAAKEEFLSNVQTHQSPLRDCGLELFNLQYRSHATPMRFGLPIGALWEQYGSTPPPNYLCGYRLQHSTKAIPEVQWRLPARALGKAPCQVVQRTRPAGLQRTDMGEGPQSAFVSGRGVFWGKREVAGCFFFEWACSAFTTDFQFGLLLRVHIPSTRARLSSCPQLYWTDCYLLLAVPPV